MSLSKKKIILSSGSPRRRELLQGLGLDFKVDTQNNFKEEFNPSTPLHHVPSVLSEGKSYGYWRELSEDEILLTSDTVVICPSEGESEVFEGSVGAELMGKPKDREDAIRMLHRLSGKSHHVVTAITLRDNSRHITASDTAVVHFKHLSDEEIERYVDECRPFDKAGAYGIQEWIGYIGIDKIEGSFYTIMGLPVHLVWSELQKFL